MNTKTKTYVLNHENNGGGHKQITRRQILKIEHLARLMNDTAQNLASKIYDKSIRTIKVYR